MQTIPISSQQTVHGTIGIRNLANSMSYKLTMVHLDFKISFLLNVCFWQRSRHWNSPGRSCSRLFLGLWSGRDRRRGIPIRRPRQSRSTRPDPSFAWCTSYKRRTSTCKEIKLIKGRFNKTKQILIRSIAIRPRIKKSIGCILIVKDASRHIKYTIVSYQSLR